MCKDLNNLDTKLKTVYNLFIYNLQLAFAPQDKMVNCKSKNGKYFFNVLRIGIFYVLWVDPVFYVPLRVGHES